MFLQSIPKLSRSLAQNNKLFRRTYTSSRTENYGVVVVGGGIVGTASAREILLRHPTWKVAVVEKEGRLAFHQTGHNSGVVHAGIYYKPGTLNAKLCVERMQLCYKYFNEKNIPYKKVGKLIVATEEAEIPRLLDLQARAIANGVPDLQLIDGDKIQEIEPYCEGLKALWSPHTGIVDFALVTQHYAGDIRAMGSKIHLDYEVDKFYEAGENSEYPVTIRASNTDIVLQTKYASTCAGLQSDIVAEMTGCHQSPRIVPIRGWHRAIDTLAHKLVCGKPSVIHIGAGQIASNSPIKIRKHIRCPGTRKLIEAFKKLGYCVVRMVDEYKTSQLCARCFRPFPRGTKSNRYKKCDDCHPNPILQLPTLIVTNVSKRELQMRRSIMKVWQEMADFGDAIAAIQNESNTGRLVSKKQRFQKTWKPNANVYDDEMVFLLAMELIEQHPHLKTVWHRDICAAKLILYRGHCALFDLPIHPALLRPPRRGANLDPEP